MIQSAGVIIIDRGCKPTKVLILRAYSDWDFPKGRVEKGESLRAAAIRELQEETGLTMSDCELTPDVAPSITYGSGSKKKRATFFVANRKSGTEPFLPVNPELGKPEHDEWRWVDATQLSSIMPGRFGPVVNYINKIL